MWSSCTTRSGFNPCFDGSVARGKEVHVCGDLHLGFNPCFDGSVARGRLSRLVFPADGQFQSLF